MNAKRQLYRAIVRNLAPLGVPEQDVMTVLLEPPLEDRGIRVGRSADGVDLGDELDV